MKSLGRDVKSCNAKCAFATERWTLSSPCQGFAAWYLALWPAQCCLEWAQKNGYQTWPQMPPWVAAGTRENVSLSTHFSKVFLLVGK